MSHIGHLDLSNNLKKNIERLSGFGLSQGISPFFLMKKTSITLHSEENKSRLCIAPWFLLNSKQTLWFLMRSWHLSNQESVTFLYGLSLSEQTDSISLNFTIMLQYYNNYYSIWTLVGSLWALMSRWDIGRCPVWHVMVLDYHHIMIISLYG